MINKTDLIDSFESIIDAMHEDLLITDGNGVVIKISPEFEKVYGISSEEAIGKTVYELEERGYFSPSVTSVVLKTKKKVTMEQDTKEGRKILVSATPIFKGNIEGEDVKFVVSFSRDITEIIDLKVKAQRLQEEVNLLKRKAISSKNFIFESEEMMKVADIVKKVSGVDANVLLLGPSGAGKTLLAKIIHEESKRKKQPFIEINCAAIPENLLESELFGYEKGSFTGALAEGKTGLIEMAQGGTLFLDEISEMPINLQAKLLKVIQDKTIKKIGGSKNTIVDFRLVTATNKNLEKMVKEGVFREDLFYRISVVDINIPPLRERKKEILPLINFFMEEVHKKYGLNIEISPEALGMLIDYQWPGNVRELGNLVERLCITNANGTIKPQDLPENILNAEKVLNTEEEKSLKTAVEKVESRLILKAYQKHGTSIGVATELGISQATASRKISKYLKKEVSEIKEGI